MSNYLATDTDLTSVANAIRTKGGTSASLEFPDEFVSAIGAITTGTDVSDTTATESDVLAGKYFHKANGSKVQGSIVAKSSSDLTVSGATVTAPAGYYASNASESVASGTEGTPTATKGTVSNHSVTVTPSVTNTEGYISGGTHTGTGVTVSVSELESGTKSILENGTTSVSGYSSVNVDVKGLDIVFSINRGKTVISSITCNKTFTYCVQKYNLSKHGAVFSDNNAQLNYGAMVAEKDSSKIVYYGRYNTDGVISNLKITYASDGTITWEQDPIPSNTSSDLTASNLTVTAPAGYYYEAASKTLTDNNLTAGNIKKDVSIFGVTGDLEGITCPIFTLIRDGNDEITAIICNISSNQCIQYYTNTSDFSAILRDQTWEETYGGNVFNAYADNSIDYYFGNTIPWLYLRYYSNGTITWQENPIASCSSSDLTASNLTVTAPAGYYASAATKTLSDQNLTAGNIKKDVSIFGVTGSYEGSSSTLITKSITANGTFNASSDNADGYSSVTVNVAAPTIALSEQSNTTGTTLIATGSAATAHSIYFEFSDSTNTTITVCYDDTLIGTMITSYTPTTYGGKTVTLAQLDGVTWYQPSVIPTGVELIDYNDCESGKSINIQGEAVATEWYYTSDYTEIDRSMTFSYTASLWHYVAFYDESHNAIETLYAYTDATVDPNDSNTGHGTLNSTKIPANTKYVRLCGTGADSSHISLIRTA